MKIKLYSQFGLPVLLFLYGLINIPIFFTSCKEVKSFVVDDVALADEIQGDNWLAYGRTHNERRFSPLDQINSNNVNELKVDWFLDLPQDVGIVSTPLVVEGVLYFIGSLNVVRAVDAVTGGLLWEYDPKIGAYYPEVEKIGWPHNRGITYWKGKVYLATLNGRLIALDAATGEQIWSVQTFSPDAGLFITGAPKAFKGKILIGNGGADHGPHRGFVTAYDAETGEQAWRFYIVPGNPADGFENEAMEMAAKTWTGEWWKYGGGGNSWHGFTYDADLDVLYIGTGNGSPWNQKVRSPQGGDNLFLCSIVALDPDTGEYLWHYQTTPGETWDYNSNMDIVLADLVIDGEEVKVLLHAPKNGFFYVINRETGKLISAEPIAEMTWATHVDLETGRPVEIPGARFEKNRALIAPSNFGAHSWHAMSYSPKSGLAYIPTIHSSIFFDDQSIDLKNWEPSNKKFDQSLISIPNDPITRDTLGSLQAWDPVKQKLVWRVPMLDKWNAGTMVTAGNLVVQGKADGQLVAYRAETGKELWRFFVGSGISAPPITYAVDGRQYIAILVGWGGASSGVGGKLAADLGWSYGIQMRRLISFSLDGEEVLPESPPPHIVRPIPAPDFHVDPQMASNAMSEFETICSWCHGPQALASGMAPDLRASGVVLSQDLFAQVVREGSATARGMPAYKRYSDEELLGLRHYIRQKADEATVLKD